MVRARDWLALALVGIASTSVADGRPPTDLVAGDVPIHRREGARYGPRRATLVRAWEYVGGGKSEHEWLEQQYGKKRVVSVKIPGTRSSLLIVDGVVTPLVSVWGPHELWRVDGLEGFCKFVTFVETGEKQVALTAPGGDMRSILRLDFARGLSIDYWEEYDGF